MQMGMVDRGADLSWLSQYPHEREVLLPPLTGIEALTSDVDGSMLVIHSRLSLNLAAQTLEQVLSRRHKMLMDMAYGIELELRDMLKDTKAAEKLALNILRKAMDYFYRNYSLEWFNNGWLGRPHIPLPSAPPALPTALAQIVLTRPPDLALLTAPRPPRPTLLTPPFRPFTLLASPS